MKVYTDLEQSKKLAEILPLESADMCYIKHSSSYNPNWEFNEDFPPMILGNISINEIDVETLPCWSLSALLELMPNKIVVNDENYFLNFTKKRVEYRGIVTWDGQKSILKEAENLLDAAFEMIDWLKENVLIPPYQSTQLSMLMEVKD